MDFKEKAEKEKKKQYLDISVENIRIEIVSFTDSNYMLILSYEDVGVQRYFANLIPDCYVLCTLAILKNILLSEHFHPMKGRTSKKTGEKETGE